VFQHLELLLPQKAGSVAMIVALIGSIIGLAMYITGARFSRSILTLAAVAMGTSVGMRMPMWCGWHVDPMAPAVAGAIVLGVSAYAFHRVWVGAWLGAVLSIWAALALWATRGSAFHWRWPEYDPSQTLPQYFSALWQNVPDSMQQCLGFSAAAAMLVGISAALLWPRVGIALLWSAAGVSVLLPAVVTALSQLEPSALKHVPRQTPDQLALLAGIVGIGAIFQWRTNPMAGAASEGSGGGEKKSEKSGKSGKERQAAD
jgi:hypothetical protein